MGYYILMLWVCALLHGHTAPRSTVEAASDRKGINTNTTLSEAAEQRTFFELLPLSLFANHSSARHGIEKRSLTVRDSASSLTGNVALQNASSLYFAAKDFRRNVGMQFAKFDVTGDGKKKILSMEEFGDVVENAVCDEAGVIGLTFTKDIEFRQVREEWQWINGNDDHTVVLITETERCDRNSTDGTARQPWLIRNVAFDNTQNNVELTGKPVSFQEAFGKAWHVSIARDHQPTPLLASRDKQPAQISLNSDFSGVGMNLPPALALAQVLTSDDPIGMLSCDPCYTKGELDLEIDIDGLDGAKVKIGTRDVEASFTLRLEVYQALAGTQTDDYEIWGMVPPASGIYIKNILDIGPTIKFLVSTGFTTPVDRELALAVGFILTMSGPMEFTWDTANSSEAKLTGFNPVFKMLPPGISKDVDIVGSIGPKLELSLDCTVLGQGAKVGLAFAAGALSLNVTTDSREPACGGKGSNAIRLTPTPEGDHNDTVGGVNLDLNLNQDILAFQSVGLLGEGASNTQTLASTSYDLASTCIPITGVTVLRPSAATASVNSYIPFAGDLADMPWSPVLLVAQEVAGALSELGEAAVQSLTAVVAPKVTEAFATLTSEVASVVTAAAEPAQAVTSEAGNVANDVKDAFCGLFGC